MIMLSNPLDLRWRLEVWEQKDYFLHFMASNNDILGLTLNKENSESQHSVRTQNGVLKSRVLRVGGTSCLYMVGGRDIN